jgi:hypothetical protein
LEHVGLATPPQATQYLFIEIMLIRRRHKLSVGKMGKVPWLLKLYRSRRYTYVPAGTGSRCSFYRSDTSSTAQFHARLLETRRGRCAIQALRYLRPVPCPL